MDRTVLTGVGLVGGALLSIGAVAAYVVKTAPVFAQVIHAEPVLKAVTVRERQCRDPQGTKMPVADRHRSAGTVISGMVGGTIGHQVGDGRGGKIATSGAPAGKQIQKQRQVKDVAAAKGHNCRTVNRVDQKIVAYDVRYRLDGKISTVRMERKPGARIPVKDGKLVLLDKPKSKKKLKG